MTVPFTSLPMTHPLTYPEAIPSTYFVEGNVWLGRFFSVIHLTRKTWHWHRTAKEVYQYFQNPRLAVGDLVTATPVKDSPIFQTATLVVEVISCGFQAEKERQLMVCTWVELIDQIKNLREMGYSTPKLRDPKNSLNPYFSKLKTILFLLSNLLIHSYTFSMHLMDITDLLHDPTARKRANRRLMTNLQTIFQQFNQIMTCHTLRPMPIFTYFGIKTEDIAFIHDKFTTAIPAKSFFVEE